MPKQQTTLIFGKNITQKIISVTFNNSLQRIRTRDLWFAVQLTPLSNEDIQTSLQI